MIEEASKLDLSTYGLTISPLLRECGAADCLKIGSITFICFHSFMALGSCE